MHRALKTVLDFIQNSVLHRVADASLCVARLNSSELVKFTASNFFFFHLLDVKKRSLSSKSKNDSVSFLSYL